MSTTHIHHTLIAGLASAVLYVVVFKLGLGFVFLFLPTIPLFWVGLSRPSKHCLEAGIVAALALALIATPAAGALHWLTLTLPTWFVSHEATKRVKVGELTLWFPIGNSFAHLSAYACLAQLLASIRFLSSEGGLPTIISKSIHAKFAAAQAQYGAEFNQAFAPMLNLLAGELSFLLISITFWMWMLSILFHGWITNRLLVQANKAVRPAFFITPFPLPSWLISLLIISAVAILVGSPSLAFAGKSCFIMLLFPYFLQGCAWVHFATLKWPNRLFFLIIMYVVLFLFIWPVLVLVGIALYQQLNSLNKHLSAGGTSSKS